VAVFGGGATEDVAGFQRYQDAWFGEPAVGFQPARVHRFVKIIVPFEG
jgi:hypothetical protein